MPVYLLWEWENPKEEERNKMRYKLGDEVRRYREKKLKEGVRWEVLALTDNTRRSVVLYTFETMEDFDKIWNDEEWQRAESQWSYYVDNCTVRILRPSIRVPPV